MEIYQELFNSLTEDDDYPREENKEEEKKTDEDRRLSWHTLIYILAEGDVVKFNQIIGLNAHLCLTHRLFEQTNKNLVKWIKSK